MLLRPFRRSARDGWAAEKGNAVKISEIHTTEKGGWQPVEGETVTGRILDIDVTTGTFGRYPVVDIELDDGVVSCHAFHDHLRRKLSSRGAQVGELVSVTYRGRAGDGAATDAYLYDVRVGPLGEPKRFDYDALQYTGEPANQPKRAAPPTSDVPSDGVTASADDPIPF